VGEKERQLYEEELCNLPMIPLTRQGTIHSAAAAAGIPKSTFHWKMKEGAVHAHSNAVKPYLTEENMRVHVAFCLNHIDPIVHQRFHDMIDVVHVDKKWFYLYQPDRKYYLGDAEPDPHQTSKSKRFITKVMFLSAVACPHYDHH
jgi:hypothetical protein